MLKVLFGGGCALSLALMALPVHADRTARKPSTTPASGAPHDARPAPSVKSPPKAGSGAPKNEGVRPADGSVHDEGALARDVAALQLAWSTEAEVGRLEPRLLERGDLCKDTHEQVIRLAPPLVVETAALDWLLDQLRAVFG